MSSAEWFNVEVWSLDDECYVIRRATAIKPGEFVQILGGQQMMRPFLKLSPGEAHLQTDKGDNCVYQAIG